MVSKVLPIFDAWAAQTKVLLIVDPDMIWLKIWYDMW